VAGLVHFCLLPLHGYWVLIRQEEKYKLAYTSNQPDPSSYLILLVYIHKTNKSLSTVGPRALCRSILEQWLSLC